MSREADRHAIGVFYKAEETRVGTNIYAHVQCFRGKPGQGSVSAFRTSAPFVLACRYGSREVVPGSVVETLRNIRRLIERLSQSTARSGEKLESLPKGALKDAAYQEYEQEISNALVLVSCQLRNVFHAFPAVGEKPTVPMFDYEGKPVESVRMHVLLDLFVHNRYMHLHNEYITDLFSGKPPAGTVFAEKFMGYRFKVNDFLLVAQQAIESLTLKHLATRLRSDMKRAQHGHAALRDGVPDPERGVVLPPPGGALAHRQGWSCGGCSTRRRPSRRRWWRRPGVGKPPLPRISTRPRCAWANRVDDDSKNIGISVKGTFRYTVDGEVVHTEPADRETEVEYGEFFERVHQGRRRRERPRPRRP